MHCPTKQYRYSRNDWPDRAAAPRTAAPRRSRPEIGWRGFLLPRLREVTSPRRAAVLTGFLHGLFHVPLITLTTSYDSVGSPWLVAPIVVATITAGGVLYAWLWERSASIWPVAIAHNAVNTVLDAAVTTTVTTSPVALSAPHQRPTSRHRHPTRMPVSDALIPKTRHAICVPYVTASPRQARCPIFVHMMERSGRKSGFEAGPMLRPVGSAWVVGRQPSIRLAATVAPSSQQASRPAASIPPTIDSGDRSRFHFSPVAIASTPRTAPTCRPRLEPYGRRAAR